MRLTALFIISLLAISGCDQKNDAVFGVKWNTSPDRYRYEKLPTYQVIPQRDGGALVYVTSPPSGKIGTGEYRFYFNDSKLKKIIYRSYDMTGNDSVETAKKEYNRLKSMLGQQFDSQPVVSEHVYNTSFAFFPCVSNPECGSWSSTFSNKDTTAKLSISMGNNGNGYSEDRIAGSVSIEYTPK